MQRFLRELRRREVFRTAGLYVGISWITIEAASILLPTFDAPEWIMRALIIAAIVGFPIMLVLAWVYDVTDHGVVVQGDPTDTVVAPIGGRKMDFIVIGVLSVALVFSLYMNFRSGPVEIVEPDPLSILIADFDNRTGDPVFDGSLGQALQIGLEGASFITAYPRRNADRIALALQPDATGLDADLARLVATREGIGLTLTGSIEQDGDGYRINVQAVDPTSGETSVDLSEEAGSKLDVLPVVNALTADIREALGDRDIASPGEEGETFSATSIEALQDYTTAQQLAGAGEREAAIASYQRAVERDPNFGRALSGWALTLFYLGRTEEATALWETALSKMETMTPRERYRTLGLYYMTVSGNYQKAIETYQALVAEFPADNAAYNNLAVAQFATLDFDAALENGRKALDVYPNNVIMSSNYALYAMYAGDFETATREARRTLQIDSSRFIAWLPIAMASAAGGDLDAARAAYDSMASISDAGATLAALGHADLDLYQGNARAAVDTLRQGLAGDRKLDNARAMATKQVVLAGALADLGNTGESAELLSAVATSRGHARQVPAALLAIELGDVGLARSIAGSLGASLQPQSRAYALLINAMIDLANDDTIGAIDKLRAAIELADLWLVRYHLGLSYLQAEFMAEAADEFGICEARIGEATAIFLDDQPTWRYVSELPYWTAVAQSGIGMLTSARQNFEVFLSYRADGPLAEDARDRLN